MWRRYYVQVCSKVLRVGDTGNGRCIHFNLANACNERVDVFLLGTDVLLQNTAILAGKTLTFCSSLVILVVTIPTASLGVLTWLSNQKTRSVTDLTALTVSWYCSSLSQICSISQLGFCTCELMAPTALP